MSIEHEDNPSPGRALTEWELAGALLGHLNDVVPFGDFTMGAATGLQERSFAYTWHFSVMLPSSSETEHPYTAAEHTFFVEPTNLRRESDRLGPYAQKLLEDAYEAMFT